MQKLTDELRIKTEEANQLEEELAGKKKVAEDLKVKDEAMIQKAPRNGQSRLEFYWASKYIQENDGPMVTTFPCILEKKTLAN